ncbi:MAG: sigma-70 family RNA polymerase sigma factor [Actinomycetota bacterium]|nr:sigma-70 family RNA polymerase sigma factor [Actinomycetota bacterium]
MDTIEERRLRTRVAAARAGDREAMRDLYVSHAASVHDYVLRIVGNRHDAEDVTQQVFAKLITSLDQYRPGEAPFMAWVLRVAHNVAIDHVRRPRTVPWEQVPDADARGARDGVAEQARASLQAALGSLPEAQRDVLVLTHFVGLSPAEIASQLGRSVRSVHGLQYRGRVAAREALQNLGSAPATVAPLVPPRWDDAPLRKALSA